MSSSDMASLSGLRGGRMGFDACTGCGLCLLACPVWKQTADPVLAPRQRTKMLQQGATPTDVAAALDACTLCGACEPACPEDIDLLTPVLRLRRERPFAVDRLQTGSRPPAALAGAAAGTAAATDTLLLPGAPLGSDPARRDRLLRRIPGARLSADDGRDVVADLEAGRAVRGERWDAFLDSFGEPQRIVVGEGLLIRLLDAEAQLSRSIRVEGIGEALIQLPEVRRAIRPRDFYVIDSRPFGLGHARLVGVYDRLRQEMGCAMNLDTQRMAMATGASAIQHRLGLPVIDALAEAARILDRREFDRVIVEDLAELPVYAAVTGRPVIHVADL